MPSTIRDRNESSSPEQPQILRWRSWPLLEQRRWSWLVLLAITAVGSFVWLLGGGWLLALAFVVGMAATLWQFLFPLDYELRPFGLRYNTLRRTRLVPWQSVRAYQPRATGVIMYQRANPTHVDVLQSLFVPYPSDEDELLCVLRQYLSHAVELPS